MCELAADRIERIDGSLAVGPDIGLPGTIPLHTAHDLDNYLLEVVRGLRERGSASMSEFDRVWQRITALAVETFHQKKGKPFTYAILGNTVKPDGVNRQIPRSHFGRAYERFPLDGPGPLQDLQGPSYLFAILADSRVAAAGARHIVIRLGALDLHAQRDQLARIAALTSILG